MAPWPELCALVEPYYPKAGQRRPPVGVERMLRMYFVQQWFNLSDPGVEEAVYHSIVLRQFVGIDLGGEPVPEETTVCKFRHLLEEHNQEQILGTVNLHLQSKGVRITTGTIVDATILHAPSSTENREQQRDPEMHQTRKGKQWYFQMKAHVGASKTKLIHTAVATTANGGRCHDTSGPITRRGDAGVGRPSVSRAERSDSPVCSAGSDSHGQRLPQMSNFLRVAMVLNL